MFIGVQRASHLPSNEFKQNCTPRAKSVTWALLHSWKELWY